jgi:hypothetical protein
MPTPPWENDPNMPDVDNLPPVSAYDAPDLNPITTVRPGDKLHTIHGYIVRETDKAVLIEVMQVDNSKLDDKDVPGGSRNMWFPLSQVSTIHRSNDAGGEYDYIRAKEWICKQKDLI